MTLTQLASQTEDRLDQAITRIGTLAAEHAAVITAKDAEITTLKQAVATSDAYRAEMNEKVFAVLKSGDPAQYEALAKDFLTPAIEKERAEKLARAEALRAEAAQLEAQLS